MSAMSERSTCAMSEPRRRSVCATAELFFVGYVNDDPVCGGSLSLWGLSYMTPARKWIQGPW